MSVGSDFKRENVARKLFQERRCDKEVISREKMSVGSDFKRKWD